MQRPSYNPATAIAAPTPILFNCEAISVWHGDGPITCADGRKIRLAGIHTRELDGAATFHITDAKGDIHDVTEEMREHHRYIIDILEGLKIEDYRQRPTT